MTVRESQNKQYFRNCAGSGPEAVDVHVGALVRQRRTMLGISQGRLGEALGLTFQQVQKYERGVNRISAGRLYHISVILDVPINYFFEGISPAVWKALPETSGPVVQTEYDHDPISQPDARELVQAYNKIKDSLIQRRIFELINQLGKILDYK